ncbi:zinc finger CCCH domain-containing protein 25 [Oryza brachyantha]|uniref:RRM domain-containing protein n=1 Tax=Oryza brachyantha TaxID=4533 RepID=J3LUC8_ORYBR|nr:zinc finger CCCH domain-containing protein 25 [Oryza brachyantha]
MNPLTQVKRTQVINQKEALLGIGEDASWHAKFKDSAYVFVGGIPFDLTEGDLLAVFAQYGEVVDVNLVRDKGTGKSKGFAFLAYEDQRSTILAVDNLNGAKVLGRIIRVDHVSKYKKKEEEDEEELQKKREARGVCYAFQKGECNRGASCRYSHDEQRNANTGWGSKEESKARWEHDRHHEPPKSHKKFPSDAGEPRFPDRTKEESKSTGREGQSSRSEAYRDRDSRIRHSGRSSKDHDRHRHDRSPERSRGDRQRNNDRYAQGRDERSERYKPEMKHDGDQKRSRRDTDSSGHYERGIEESERYRKSRQ